MKKVAILLLALVSCSGTYLPDDDFTGITPNWSDGVSPDTITGLYLASYASRSTTETWGWSALRVTTTSTFNLTVNLATPSYVRISSTWYTGDIRTIIRSGIIFDASTVPDDVMIDSVKLKLYHHESGGTFGTAIYSAPYLRCTDTDRDWMTKIGGALSPTYRIITYSSSTTDGWHTYSVNSLPKSLVYGDNYISYGIGEYLFDYIGSDPYPSGGGGGKIDVGTSNTPQLIIYYSDIPTPSPKKIKIIGVI